jgi:hypothetical protein
MGFEPKISAYERSHFYALQREATGPTRQVAYSSKIKDAEYVLPYRVRIVVARYVETVSSAILRNKHVEQYMLVLKHDRAPSYFSFTPKTIVVLLVYRPIVVIQNNGRADLGTSGF